VPPSDLPSAARPSQATASRPAEPATADDAGDRETEKLLSELRDLPPDDPRYEGLRAQVVTRYTGLARRIARRYANRGEPVEDLEQAALVGLVKAINGFDPEVGPDFVAYARPMMTGEVKRHFRDLTWAVRVPRKVQEGRIELNQASAALSHRLGRKPTMAELAAELKLPMDDLADLMAAAAAYSALSLNLPDGADENRTLADTLGGPDDALDAIIDHESLAPMLDALPPRELRLLLLRFFGNQSQSEIAAELGVSQMQVSRLLSTTLARLRASMLADG
jgi:RNA polymerase sigma-B factor